MGDFGIKKNASGYYDEPCYKAVTAGPRPGEIYTRRAHSDYFLIIASDGHVSACLKLDENNREGKIKIRARTQMYTDPIKISYVYNDLFCEFVRMLPDEEMAAVRRIVARTLGLEKR